MRIKHLRLASFIFLGMLLGTGCVKDEDKKGCLDITAVNYVDSADVNEGCLYENSTQLIFENGAYGTFGADEIIFFPCIGSREIIDYVVEPGDTVQAMALTTDANGDFFGYFVTLNTHDARYYSSTDSRFTFSAQLANDNITQSIGTYIRGVDPETHAACENVLVSDRQMMDLNALNASTMTEVNFNILDYNDHNLNNVGILGGFEFSGNPSETVLIINNVSWKNHN